MDNNVLLVGVYGGDETHALSAWTSTSRELTQEKRNRMSDLIRSLAVDGHHTPFEKSSLHFLLTLDTASHVHLLKHRIGVSTNGESARYKELKSDKFYVPVDWPDDMRAEFIEHTVMCYARYHEAIKKLTTMGFTRKRAKESARFYLPYANQLDFDVMFNFRSFDHFLRLRYAESSQVEIRNVARRMLELVRDTHQFDMTLWAFGWIDENCELAVPRK